MIDTIHLIIQLKVICDDASSNPKIGNIERGPFKKAQHKCYLRNKCNKFRHQIYQIFCRKKRKHIWNCFTIANMALTILKCVQENLDFTLKALEFI